VIPSTHTTSIAPPNHTEPTQAPAPSQPPRKPFDKSNTNTGTDNADHTGATGGFNLNIGGSGVEGILGGLSGLLRTLGELAEKGEELKRSGSLTDKQGREVNFRYGVRVRTLNEGRDVRVEPFGNLKRDERTGEATFQEVREPVCDIFEEDDHVKLVLEMPGISESDVTLDVQGDVMTISAERNGKRYRKEVLLPAALECSKMSVACNNGLVEVRCMR
jgi:HSP20 family protein